MSEKKITQSDPIRTQFEAVDAATLVLIGMFNRLSQRVVEAGIVDAEWLETQFDDLAESLQKSPVLAENPEVKRRMPFMKEMMLEGILKPKADSQ